MVLLQSQQIKSCVWNCRRAFKLILLSKNPPKDDVFINIGIIFVKCILLLGREDSIKSEAVGIISKLMEKLQEFMQYDILLNQS